MLKEFQEFIGGAFSKIVDSLVKDIITPLLSPLTNKVDFSEYVVRFGPFGPFGIGNFVNAVIQFVLVGFALFLLVKGINGLRRGIEDKPAPTEDVSVSQLSQQNVEQNREMIALLRSIADRKSL